MYTVKSVKEREKDCDERSESLNGFSGDKTKVFENKNYSKENENFVSNNNL